MLRCLTILILLFGVSHLSGQTPTPVLDRAAAAVKVGQYEDAAGLYGDLALEAMAKGDCAMAGKAVAGLRKSAYWGRQGELLEAVNSEPLWALVERDPLCAAPLVVELALGYQQTGQKEKVVGLLEEALAKPKDTFGQTIFQRAQQLISRDIAVELTPTFLDPPLEVGSVIWESAFPVMIHRPDQVLAGHEMWRGPLDASVDIRAGRIAQNLYIRIKVTDDTHLTVGDRHDRIFLSIDTSRGSGTISNRSPLGAAAPLVLELDTQPESSPHAVPGVNRVWKMVECFEGGYVVLVCIPKGTAGDVEIDAGNRYAIDVMIQDVDPDGTSILRWMELSTDPKALYWAGVLSIS